MCSCRRRRRKASSAEPTRLRSALQGSSSVCSRRSQKRWTCTRTRSGLAAAVHDTVALTWLLTILCDTGAPILRPVISAIALAVQSPAARGSRSAVPRGSQSCLPRRHTVAWSRVATPVVCVQLHARPLMTTAAASVLTSAANARNWWAGGAWMASVPRACRKYTP